MKSEDSMYKPASDNISERWDLCPCLHFFVRTKSWPPPHCLENCEPKSVCAAKCIFSFADLTGRIAVWCRHLNRWCTVCRSRSQRTSSGGGTRPASDHHHVNSTSVELPGTKVAKFVTDYSEKHLASSTSKNTPLRSPTCCGAWQLLVAAHRIVLLSCAFFSQLVHCFLQLKLFSCSQDRRQGVSI